MAQAQAQADVNPPLSATSSTTPPCWRRPSIATGASHAAHHGVAL